MSGKKKVVENSILYIFSSLLVKAMGFLLLPIYTLFLTPDEYGLTNLVNSFTNVAVFIVGFSLYSAIVRFVADYKHDKELLKNFYGTVMTFIIASGAFFIAIGIVFNDIVRKLFFDGITFYPIVLLALLLMVFLSLHAMHQAMLQGMQKGRKLTILNLIVFILTAGLKVVFIGVFDLGAVGFVLAQLIINILYAFYVYYDLKRQDLVRLGIDKNVLRKSLRYSIPLMPHNLSTRIAVFASRIFINNSGALADVGLYSIATQFGALIDTVQVAVNRAFQPWFYDILNKNDEKSKQEAIDMSSFLLIIYSFIYMIIGLFSQEVVIVMTSSDYTLAWTVIPILVVGYSIKSIYYFYVNVVMYYKKATKKLFLATVTGSILDIFFAYILVPYIGMYGSAISFIISKIIMVGIVVWISNKVENVGYSVLGMLKTILPSLIFMAIGLYNSYTNYIDVFSWFNLGYKFLILFIYSSYVYYVNRSMIKGILSKGTIKKILKKKRNKK